MAHFSKLNSQTELLNNSVHLSYATVMDILLKKGLVSKDIHLAPVYKPSSVELEHFKWLGSKPRVTNEIKKREFNSVDIPSDECYKKTQN